MKKRNWTDKAKFLALVSCKNDPCKLSDLLPLANSIIDFIVQMTFVIAVIVIMYGGIMWLTSGGSEDKIKKGKEAIQYAVIGMFWVFGAWLVVNLVLVTLTGEGIKVWFDSLFK